MLLTLPASTLEWLKLWRTPVKLIRFLIILFSSLWIVSPLRAAGDLAAGPTNYEMVEAPTAYTLMHGGYDLVMRMYEDGGLYLRGNVGFKNIFMFGFSGNATNVIGTGTIQIQAPGLFFKFKVLDEKTAPFSLAAAYDGRGYGTETNGRFYPGLQKGFYLAVSKELTDAGFVQFHGGVNAVTFDHFNSSEDLGVFGGTSFAVAAPLVFNLEVDKIPTSLWQFNANFVFNYDNPLRVGIDFRDINNAQLFSRILRVQYVSFF